jgi:hypothetical protein
VSRSTISTFQLFALFPDEDSARIYLEGRIWPSALRPYMFFSFHTP